MAILSKLAELRAKTDRQLVVLIEKELELGLQCVLISDTSINDFGSDSKSRVKARKLCARAASLLAKVDDLDKFQRLERKLKRLQAVLEGEGRVEAMASSANG